MRIRDLKWKGIPMWPPEWGISDQGVGEEGYLEGVQLRDDLTSKLISVGANHLGEVRKGIIILEDPVNLEILYRKLKENIGESLKEIGSMEIDFGRSLQKKGQKQVRPQIIQKSRSTTGLEVSES